MKIRKTDAADQLTSALQKRLENLEEKRSKALQQATRADRSDPQVDVALSKSIQEVLNPEKMEGERADKVRRITELVRSGNYKVDSSAVAAALSQEISMEVLLGPNLAPATDIEE